MDKEFTERDLPKIAKVLKTQFKPGDIVGFSGQLAAGKTTLIAELARSYGYDGRVSSPTFVIEHRYPIRGKKLDEIIHLDLYRLNKEDLPSIDWEEYRQLKHALVLVEWPERLPKGLLPINKTVTIKVINEKKRQLTLLTDPGN